VRRFDVDIDILAGSVETVAGRPAGRLLVRLTGERADAALAYLRDLGLLVEVAR